MKRDKMILRIQEQTDRLPIPKQRLVHAYAYTMVSNERKRMGIDDIPGDRPAPGKIGEALLYILERASGRDLRCIWKFSLDVERYF